MSEIKSLADQLRSRIGYAEEQLPEKPKTSVKKVPLPKVVPVLDLLRAYDLASHKSMIHTRFKTPTAQILHHFKMATGIEVNKVVGYAVELFLEQNPEIKAIVKQHLQKLEI